LPSTVASHARTERCAYEMTSGESIGVGMCGFNVEISGAEGVRWID